MTTPDLSALMALIVSDVSDAMGYTVHYQHGHMLEIANVVKQLAADPDIDKRYPLIALQQDVRLKAEPFIGVAATFKMYIITLSDPKYVAQQRIDNIFEPYLRPIFDELLYQIAASGYFDAASVEEVKERLTWYERLFWGKEGIMGNDANIFGDWVDCIELDFSDLVVYSSCDTSTRYPFIKAAVCVSVDTFYITWSESMLLPDHRNVLIRINDEIIPEPAETCELSSDGKTIKVFQSFANFDNDDVITLVADAGVFQSVAGIDASTVNFEVTNML